MSLYVCALCLCFAGLPCRFSQEWRGRYFQSGLGEIIIRDNVITTKGTCIEQDRDYYLFDNRCAFVYICWSHTSHLLLGWVVCDFPGVTDRVGPWLAFCPSRSTWEI